MSLGPVPWSSPKRSFFPVVAQRIPGDLDLTPSRASFLHKGMRWCPAWWVHTPLPCPWHPCSQTPITPPGPGTTLGKFLLPAQQAV